MSKFDEKPPFIASPEFREAYKNAMADTGDWRTFVPAEKQETEYYPGDKVCIFTADGTWQRGHVFKKEINGRLYGDKFGNFPPEKVKLDLCDCDDFCEREDKASKDPENMCRKRMSLIAVEEIEASMKTAITADALDALKRIESTDCTEEAFETIQAAIEDLEKCL